MIILEKVVADPIHHPKYIQNTINEQTALEMRAHFLKLWFNNSEGYVSEEQSVRTEASEMSREDSGIGRAEQCRVEQSWGAVHPYCTA